MASVIHPCHSKCGPWTSSVGLTRSVLDSEPQPRLPLELLSENLYFNKMPREFVRVINLTNTALPTLSLICSKSGHFCILDLLKTAYPVGQIRARLRNFKAVLNLGHLIRLQNEKLKPREIG